LVAYYFLGGAFGRLEGVFWFEPELPALTKEENLLILGGECNMWTEHAPPEVVVVFSFSCFFCSAQTNSLTFDVLWLQEIDSRVFPRILVFSQNMWQPGAKGSYLSFLDLVDKVCGDSKGKKQVKDFSHA